jgi:aspartate 1-decarboxylase
MNLRKICRAKIHKAIINKKDLNYKGSIGIDSKLLKASGILANEVVLVLNYRNAQRFETYAIEEEENSGIVALYGPAAKLGEIGDEVIILSFAFTDENEAKNIKMKVINVDKNNKLVE